MSLVIEQVRTRAQLQDFMVLPRWLYRGMPGYVPPLDLEQRELLDPKKNPFFTHGYASYWTAKREDQLVGRISAQIDLLAVGPTANDSGLFGCLDAVDDAEVVAQLARAAEDWLRQHGRRLARGPFLLSINAEPGLLIEGQTEPPVSLFPWHAAYLEKHLLEAGYLRVMRLFCHVLDFAKSGIHERLRERGDVLSRLGVSIRNFRVDHLEDDAETARQIVNDGWRNNWGFTPVSESDVRGLLRSFRPFLFPDSGFFIEYQGEPVAFVLVIPNLFEIIADLGPCPNLLGWVKLQIRIWRQRYHSFRVVLLGMVSRYKDPLVRARILAAALEELRRRMLRRRVETLISGWVLESNRPMLSVVESFGFRHSRTYGIYEKFLVETATKKR